MTIENARGSREVRGALRRSVPWFTLGLLGLGFGGALQANCLDVALRGTGSASGPLRFVPAVYHPDENGATFGVAFEESPAVVGLWEFEWRAKGNAAGPPDGTLLDFGTVAWNEDGTEVTISGGRTPAVGDVCMGAWRQVGHSTFRLTHLAMGYGPPPGPPAGYAGLAEVQMQVSVAPDEDSFHGNFTLTQYKLKLDPNVPFSAFDRSEIAFALTGTVTAKRVSPK